jgi:glycosyltransferase involved in cell wall biosynthesis
MKVSIIIPAYNEEKRIEETLTAYSDYFENLRKKNKLDYEILVVINNTTDRTEEIVKLSCKKNSRVRYLNLVKGGKGYAVIEGFKDCLKRDSHLIGFVDADMATAPQHFHELIENIGGYDAVIASRYVEGSIVKPKQTWQRIFVSRIFNLLIRGLFLMPYSDTQCGAKIFKKSVIIKIVNEVGMSQWAVDVELLYLLKKYDFKVKEHPTVWADKEYSKINFMKAGPKMALSVIRLRLLNSLLEPLLKPLRIIAKFGDELINKNE